MNYNDQKRTLHRNMLDSLREELKETESMIERGIALDNSGNEAPATAGDKNQQYADCLALIKDIEKAESFLRTWHPPSAVNLPASTESIDTPPPKPDWLLERWLPRNELTILSGQGGIGKSHLLLQLACAVASGCPEHYLNTKAPSDSQWTEPESAMFATWEDSHESIQRRTHRIMKAFESWFDFDKVKANVLYRDMKAQGPAWIPTSESGHIANRGEMAAHGHELLNACLDEEVKFLVLDSIAAIFGQDINSVAHVRPFLNFISAWCNEKEVTAVMIGHPNKTLKGGISGSVDWENAPRNVWTISTESEEFDADDSNDSEKYYYRLNHRKVNDAPKQASIPLIRREDGLWERTTEAKAKADYQKLKDDWNSDARHSPEPKEVHDDENSNPYAKAFL